MSRIDANLAIPMGDIVRPQGQAETVHAQHKQAQVAELQKASSGDAGNPVASDDLRATAQRLKQVIEAATGQSFAFGLKYDDQHKDLIVEFKDNKGEVVRELPSKEVRELKDRMDELVGLLFNKKA